MKRENLILLINALVMAVLAVGFVLISKNVIPNEASDYLFGQAVVLENEEVLNEVPDTTSYEIIYSKSEAYNVSGSFVGTVYNVQFRNSFGYDANESGAGYVELLIGITEDDLVSVEVVQLVQSSWTVRGIQEAIYTYFQEVPYLEVADLPNVNVADLDAGMTASASTSTIRSLMKQVVNLHYDIQEGPADFFGEIYGVDYVREVDQTFTATESVIGKEIVKNATNVILGAIYQLNGTAIFNSEESESGAITIYVGLDNNNDILGIEIPLETYNHTTSDFYYGGTVSFAALLEGLNVSDVSVDGPDLITGPSNSKHLVIDLIDALNTIVNGERQEPELIGVVETVSMQAGDAYDPLSGVTATDLQDGDITTNITLIGFDLVDLDAAGTYTYTVSITDADLNTTSIEVTVTVTGYPIQMFDAVYGNGYIATLDATFVPTTTVLSKYEIKNQADTVLGYVYKLEGIAEYNTEEAKTGSIAVYVALDLNGIILDVDLPLDEYHHTTSAFYYNGVVGYADLFVGLDIDDPAFDSPDLTAGPSNSKNLVDLLITNLKEVLTA